MLAVSLNFKIDSTQPDIVVDARDGATHPAAALDTKILIYEDRVRGWFLRVADVLKADGDAGYVALQIAVSQVEGMQQHFDGEDSTGASGPAFKAGCTRIFGLEAKDSAQLDVLWKAVRNGLFHDGFTKSKVFLSGDPGVALTFDKGNVVVNPWRFCDAVKRAVEAYVADLKNPGNGDLRSKFEKIWNDKNA
jgi:hypothetical protein